jgi:chromosome segregation ATPase
MRSGAEEMHRILAALRDVSHGLQRSLQDLASDLASSGEQQRALLTAVTNLERLTSSAIQNDQAATRQLAQTAARLGETAEKTITGAERASSAGRLAMEAVQNVATIAQEIAASQARIDEVITAQNSSSTMLSESLRSGEAQSAQTVRQLQDIGTGLVALQREFANVGQQNAQQLQALNAMLQRQAESGQDMATLARELGGIAMSTTQRQREVNDGVQHLLQRLDSVANALNHLIVQQPGSIRAGQTDQPGEASDSPAPARWSRSRP